MKALLVALLCTFSVAWAFGQEKPTYAEIRLSTGEVLKQATVISQSPTHVTFRIGTTLRQVDKHSLPPDLQLAYPTQPAGGEQIFLDDGRLLPDAKVVAQGAGSVVVQFPGGTVKMGRTQLPASASIKATPSTAPKPTAVETSSAPVATKPEISPHAPPVTTVSSGKPVEKAVVAVTARHSPIETAKWENVLKMIGDKCADARTQIRATYAKPEDQKVFLGLIDEDEKNLRELANGLRGGIDEEKLNFRAVVLGVPSKKTNADGTQSWHLRKELIDGGVINFAINLDAHGQVNDWALQ
jgi:hypothetical protein